MTTQTFIFLRTYEGVTHDCHCILSVGVTAGWAWHLACEITCLYCRTGRYRPQTWHKSPLLWTPQPLPWSSRLVFLERKLNNVFALDKQGRWFPWDGKSKAYAFSGQAPEGFPIASYPASGRWHDEVHQMASRFTCDMYGVSNGHEIKKKPRSAKRREAQDPNVESGLHDSTRDHSPGDHSGVGRRRGP